MAAGAGCDVAVEGLLLAIVALEWMDRVVDEARELDPLRVLALICRAAQQMIVVVVVRLIVE